MSVEFGLALENFTPETKVPDMDAVCAFTSDRWIGQVDVPTACDHHGPGLCRAARPPA